MSHGLTFYGTECGLDCVKLKAVATDNGAPLVLFLAATLEVSQ
jgi:hypothetical protein